MLSSAVANERVTDPLRAPRTVIHVRATGEIDTGTAPMLERALAPRTGVLPLLVVVDLREVTFLGIAGLVVLARTREWARRTGTPLLFVSGGTAVRRALSVLEAVLPACSRCPQ
jgi:anti-anti-sigma factor